MPSLLRDRKILFIFIKLKSHYQYLPNVMSLNGDTIFMIKEQTNNKQPLVFTKKPNNQ